MSNPFPETPSVRVVLDMLAALQRGEHGDALRRYYADDAVVVTHPNAVAPKGARADLATLLANSTRGASLMRKQQYIVRDVLEIDREKTVVIRYTWQGEIAMNAGPFRAGQTLTAEIALFVTLENDRIRAMETFDCYAPFA